MPEKSRIEWVDCAKGITILLVIIGHTVSSLYGIIYSFHMPLFFALSCYTYKYSKDNRELASKTKSAFMHLILPGIYIYLATILYFILKNFHLFSSFDYIKSFFLKKILSLIYSSACDVNINSVKIEAIGPIWFLVALFLGRTLFDYLHLKFSNKKLIVICILLSLLGVFLSKIQWLPFSMDIVFALMPIFYFGSVLYIFNVENKPCLKFMSYCVLWILAFLPFQVWGKAYLDFGVRSYPLYPFCLLTTIFGTLTVAELSVMLVKFKKIVYPLLYLGKNSLYMLLIHYVDVWFFQMWRVDGNDYYSLIYRISDDIIIFVIVMFLVEKNRKKKSSGN